VAARQHDHPGAVTRIVTALLGAGFLLQGVAFVAAPASAAASLGMALLDGVGRSTQIGDFASFFLTLGATMLAGSLGGRPRLLFVPAGMLAATAVVRTLAWLVHGAAFAATFVAVEVAVAALLVTAARREA
jgi:hypothetical protein